MSVDQSFIELNARQRARALLDDVTAGESDGEEG